MNWSRDDPATGRRGYHHGNLREALIRAALDLIAEKGPAGFTFADAARSAGVSSAAPYRHFRDRQALLADVARRGRTTTFVDAGSEGPGNFHGFRRHVIEPSPLRGRVRIPRCSR